MQEIEDAIDVLEDVINQSCSYSNDGKTFLDSMFSSSYARGIRFLAERGRIKITEDGGRRVIGEWVDTRVKK